MSATLAAIAERTRLRAARAARYMESLWSNEATSSDQGLSITPGEVVRRLRTATEAERDRAEFYQDDRAARHMAPAIGAADAALAADARWRWLIETFTLDTVEADLLCAAVAVEQQPELGRVFAYLSDDVAAILPSVTLVRLLFDHELDPARTFDPAALRRWRLAEAEPAVLAGLAGWRAAPALAPSLAGTAWQDPLLPAGSVMIAAPDAESRLLYPDAKAQVLARLEAGRPADLVGDAGSGRRTLAGQIAAERQQPLALADSAALVAGAADPLTALQAAHRLGRAEGALLCFTGAGAAATDLWDRFLARVPADAGVAMIRCLEPKDSPGRDAITLAPLDLQARLDFWQSLSDGEAPAAITAARANPGDIAALATDGPSEPVPPPSDLLTRLPTPYGWDDLALPRETDEALRGFVRQVELRGAVLRDWGFERLTHLGGGLVALFAGPSGVGKTMATQVLAAALGFELYRIDLSGVVDKYIGETEKHLRTAFDFAERPGKLLLFDEADALFGSRTQSKDSHDRYANQEINYLLQRMETFEGVAVLATNRKNELDAAFRRRLRIIVDFLPPEPAERLRLWTLALPAKAPDGRIIAQGIDYRLLADQLTLTGADIKAAALGAAFLARAEGPEAVIGMRHILPSVAREMAKHGQTMRLSIGEARTA